METPQKAPSALGRFSPFERQILAHLKDHLSQVPSVQSVVVFGSRARASSTERSDLDVAVVVDEANRWTADAVEQAKWRSLRPEASLYVNLVVISQKQLHSQSRFSRALQSEGIPLWNRNKDKRSRKSSD